MTHLTRDELRRWWMEGAPAERERILSHLAECDDCGALYGDVIDAEPVRPGTAPAFPDLVPRGYRAYRVGRRPFGLHWRSPRVLVACGAAAVILLAVIVPALRESTTPADPAGDAIRGTSLQPLAPIGRIDPPVQFRWVSPVEAARYTVEIRDERRALLFVLSTETESVDLPRDELARLTPGRTYSWEVIALGPGGEEIMRAPARSFVVSAEPR
jgi:hypothetical protein